MVMASLPQVANSGRWSATRSSRPRLPRSHCCATATATLGFVIDHQMTIDSVVMGTPVRACPIPRSATAVPSIETYSWAPRCSPRSMPDATAATAPGTAPAPVPSVTTSAITGDASWMFVGTRCGGP